METKRQNILAYVLFFVYILLLTSIILFKLPFYSPQLSDGTRVINLIPFGGSFDDAGHFNLREIIQNILLFVPLGIYLSLLKSKWSFPKKVLLVFGLSLCFEVLQFIFALGRSDITDLLDNTLGGIIGIGLYALLLKICKARTEKIVTFLALVATLLFVLRFGQLFYLSHFSMRPM